MPGLRAAGLIAGLCLLAACGSPDIGDSRHSLRRADVPIWSAAAFAPERIAGRWYQAAAISGKGCDAQAVEFAPQSNGGLAVQGQLCLDGKRQALSGPVGMVGPGRLSVPGMKDWWVIWVDADYRTMAIATPGGEFGFVLDRGQIPSDRLDAAAELFDFNGYDRTRLDRLR